MPRILQEIGTDGQHIAAAEPTRLEQDIYGVVEGAVGGKGALLTKKHKKKKHRHFWRLGKVIFYQQFGWLQVETFELLLHDLRFGCDPYHTTPVGSFASRSVQLRSGIYRRGGTDRSRESCTEFRYWIDNWLW